MNPLCQTMQHRLETPGGDGDLIKCVNCPLTIPTQLVAEAHQRGGRLVDAVKYAEREFYIEALES